MSDMTTDAAGGATSLPGAPEASARARDARKPFMEWLLDDVETLGNMLAVWIVLFVLWLWFALGIPLGPGYPVHG